LSAFLRITRTKYELGILLKLAFPIMIGQLALSMMGFVDTVMAGKVGPHDLAFVALGNSIWVPTMILMGGTLLVTTAKVAHLFGAGKTSEVGYLVHQAWWLSLILGLGSAWFLTYISADILHFLQVDEELIAPTVAYLQGIAAGFPALAFYQVLRSTSEGLGITNPNMIFAVIGLIVNIPLNYVLIFGKLGFPALGGVGCGIASGWVMWIMLLLIVGWSRYAAVGKQCNLYTRFDWPKLKVIKQLLAVGVPIGIAGFVEASIFSIVALLVGGLGAKIVAGHQIALNMSGLVFMIPYSLSMAITIRVGQSLGKGKPCDARFIAAVGIGAAICFACFSSSSMMIFRYQIAQFYTNDLQVTTLAASLLIYSALAQFSDCVQVSVVGALRGYQDTKIAMIMVVCSYWLIALPVGYSLGLTDIFTSRQGPAGFWQGLVLGLTLAAILLLMRLYCTSKKYLNN